MPILCSNRINFSISCGLSVIIQMFVVFIFNIQLHKEQGVNDKKKKKKKKKKIGTYILTWKDSDAKRTIYVGDIYTCISKDDNLIFFCCVGVLPFLRSRVSLSTIISYF